MPSPGSGSKVLRWQIGLLDVLTGCVRSEYALSTRHAREITSAAGGGRMDRSDVTSGVLPHLQLDQLLGELQARLQAVLSTRDMMNGLLEAVVAIGSDLDLETMLHRIVEAAARLADARYAALGVLGEDARLAEFVPEGLDRREISAIAHWPEVKSLLGMLIDDPRPLRLTETGADAEPAGL